MLCNNYIIYNRFSKLPQTFSIKRSNRNAAQLNLQRLIIQTRLKANNHNYKYSRIVFLIITDNKIKY